MCCCVLLTKVGTFQKTGANAPVIDLVSGVGFQAKALVLWGTANIAANVYRDTSGIQYYIGFQDCLNMTSGAGVNATNLTNNSAQDTASMFKRSALMTFQANNLTERCRGEVIGVSGNTFSVNWSVNQSGTADYFINYLALGGADITNVKVERFPAATATGELFVSGTGFQPDFIMFLPTGLSGITDTSAVAGSIGFGFAAPALSGAIGLTSGVVGSWAIGMKDASANMVSKRTNRTDRCLSQFDTDATLRYDATFVGVTGNGFSLNFTDAAPRADNIAYLAIKGGSIATGSVTSATGAINVSGIGFTPKVVFMGTAGGENDATTNVVAASSRICVGATDNASGTQNSWLGDTDATATAIGVNRKNNDAHILFTAIDNDTAASSTLDSTAYIQSFNANGFTINWDDAPATNYPVAYAAFGDTIVVTPPTPTSGLPPFAYAFGPTSKALGEASTGNIASFLGPNVPPIFGMQAQRASDRSSNPTSTSQT